MIFSNIADETIEIPDGVGVLRVYNCPGLTSLEIPDGVKDVWVDNCPGLTSLEIPDGVKDVWVYNCPGLTSAIQVGSAIISGICKWRVIRSGTRVEIGCVERSVSEWYAFFDGEDVISTPRDNPEFALIHKAFLQTVS